MRPIDADAIRMKAVPHTRGEYGYSANIRKWAVLVGDIDDAPTIDPESLRPQGEWVWKHRHHGGFHRYTGVDDFGNTHTITVDERFECDEPYCPNCGKWNESVFLNYCPNCGARMKT